MFPSKDYRRGGLGSLLLLAAGISTASVSAQSETRPVIAHGEVTAGDVYVRSGPSLNHYTICKLNAGHRIDIVSEELEWYEILPPEGTFSLISGDYVDRGEAPSGVVNGDNVRVRAGSLLHDNKYTVQTMLSKGARVTVLGRNPDGFLRITPPPAASLWISRRFVEVVPEELLKLERETAQPSSSAPLAERSAPSSGAESPVVGSDAPAAARPKAISSALAQMPPSRQREALKRIDEATRAEWIKPIFERRLQPLIDRYQAVASQTADEFARRYAQKRVEQLTDSIALSETVRRMRKVGERAESKRREFLEARAQIPDPIHPVPSGLDAQGELRISALYPPGSIPRRYRLVDRSPLGERILGYVEFPADSDIDVNLYLGRHVGVRAAQQRWQQGGVDPVPIYVVRELVLLSPTATGIEPTGEK